MALKRDYPHLSFKMDWQLTKDALMWLGQCDAFVRAICYTPIMPEYYQELMSVSLIKGAQATTAIEGNTLTDEEIELLSKNQKLPPSKYYQEIEVKNILQALNEILFEVIYQEKEELICPELLLRFHRLIGKDLGEHFSAIPGQFRNSDVTVGAYRCPDYRDVPELIEKYCTFLKEFNYENGLMSFGEIITQAIVAHVYLEWIHPFGDGNGRTGRMVEFYILTRGQNPDIVSHILSNHYNLTRPEYYRQLDRACKTRNLSDFIQYAVLGFRDGLLQTLEKIQTSQLLTTWQRFVYDKFDAVEMKHKETFKRKRKFALEIPIDRKFKLEEIPGLNIPLAQAYSNLSVQTLQRDVSELLGLGIIKEEEGLLFANVSLLNKMIAKRKGLLQKEKK